MGTKIPALDPINISRRRVPGLVGIEPETSVKPGGTLFFFYLEEGDLVSEVLPPVLLYLEDLCHNVGVLAPQPLQRCVSFLLLLCKQY